MKISVQFSWKSVAAGLFLANACALIWYYTVGSVETRLPAHGSLLTGNNPYWNHIPQAVPRELPPCGEICSFNGTVRHGKRDDYPQLMKKIKCPNIIGRMSWDKYYIIYPPPRQPPEHLRLEYTQNGQMPFRNDWYFSDFNPKTNKFHRVYTTEKFQQLQQKDKDGKVISHYPTGRSLSQTIKSYSDRIKGKRGFVIGTTMPWVEALLLNSQVGHITTLEYGNLTLQHPNISVLHPSTFAKKLLEQRAEPFDFGVAFSSLEHSGLGRYGDPLNPYGDLEAMAQAWCMTKPGGLFILGLPATKDGSSYIQWNANRIYGRDRFSQVTANWDLLDVRHSPDIHKILVLERL